MKKYVQWDLVFLLGIVVTLICSVTSCTDIANPFEDPKNLTMEIGVLNSGDKQTVNDSIVMSLSVNIKSMVDWMIINFGDNDSLVIHSADFTIYGNDTMTHKYKSPGSYVVSSTAHLTNGGTKSVAPITIKINGVPPKIDNIVDTIRSVNAGGNSGFPLVLNGTKPFTFLWLHGADSVGGTELFTIANAKLSDSGYYKCVVSNAWGKDTSGSIRVIIKVVPTAPPVISSTIAGDGKVTVSWAPVIGAASYNLYYVVGKTVDKSGIKMQSVTSPKEVIGIANGMQFAFAVSSVNEGGESALSSVQTATPQIPVTGAPNISSVTPSSGKVTVSWDAMAGAMSYNLYYKTGTSVDKSSNKLTGVTSPRVVDSLINGTQYAIAVSVVNAGGESGLSTVQLATPQVPAPGTTAITAASAGNAKVTITWDPVAGATSYNLYYAASTTVDKSGKKITGATSPKEVSGLTNGTNYAFAVSVVNAGGESALSMVQLVTP